MTTPIQFTEKNLISDLRSGSGYAIGEIYYTSDPGQEGFLRLRREKPFVQALLLTISLLIIHLPYSLEHQHSCLIKITF